MGNNMLMQSVKFLIFKQLYMASKHNSAILLKSFI